MIILQKTNGSKVCKGDVILEVYAKDEKSLQTGSEQLKEAISYSKDEIKKNPLIYKKIN